MQLYSSVLVVLSMSVKKWTVIANRYNILLLLTAIAVYVYRDIWPLATYQQKPVDSDDRLLWIKLPILVLTSLGVPLFIPRRYIPVDPKVGFIILLNSGVHNVFVGSDTCTKR